jgi:D-sedoheptulose 7-phosphate isomerase
MEETIERQVRESMETKRRILEDAEVRGQILAAAEMLIRAYREGRKSLLAGNGGSAADAQHIAAELVARFDFDRPGLPSIALTTDTSILTAMGNDYGYEAVFSRQVQALGNAGDVFVAISTSGNSPSILKALAAGKAAGLLTIGLTGGNGGKMVQLCDVCIRIPSVETPRIQESHILIGHILCGLVENALFAHLKGKP